MCRYTVEYYALCGHLDRTHSSVRLCKKALWRGYDCYIRTEEAAIPHFGRCSDCKSQSKQHKQKRKLKHQPTPEMSSVADANEHLTHWGPWALKWEKSFLDNDLDERLKFSPSPSLDPLDGPSHWPDQEFHSLTSPLLTPPDSASLSDQPLAERTPEHKTRFSFISVLKKTSKHKARVHRSLIPVPINGKKQQNTTLSMAEEFDQVTF